MFVCDDYEADSLDETKVKPNRFTGFGCRNYEVKPYILMRDCEGYYYNGEVFKFVDG